MTLWLDVLGSRKGVARMLEGNPGAQGSGSSATAMDAFEHSNNWNASTYGCRLGNKPCKVGTDVMSPLIDDEGAKAQSGGEISLRAQG